MCSDNLKDSIPNFNPDNLYKTNSIITGVRNNWLFYIQKVISIDIENNKINYINKKIIKAEIDNDFSFIQGNYDYQTFLEKNFFNNYLKNKICNKNIWHKNEMEGYFIFECDKKNFTDKDLKNFPKLNFICFNGDVKLEFDYNNLFTETKHKYFFNIIFSIYNVDNWIFGKIFLQKYLTIINSEDNTIQVYLDDNNSCNNISNVTNNSSNKIKNNEENNKLKINYKIILFVILFIIFGFLCFTIGRKLRKERRKKANELIDEYDYDGKNEKDRKDNNEINLQNL